MSRHHAPGLCQVLDSSNRTGGHNIRVCDGDQIKGRNLTLTGEESLTLHTGAGGLVVNSPVISTGDLQIVGVASISGSSASQATLVVTNTQTPGSLPTALAVVGTATITGGSSSETALVVTNTAGLAVDVKGNVEVEGSTSLTGNTSVTASPAATAAGIASFTVSANTLVHGTVEIVGDTNFTGDFTLTGTASITAPQPTDPFQPPPPALILNGDAFVTPPNPILQVNSGSIVVNDIGTVTAYQFITTGPRPAHFEAVQPIELEQLRIPSIDWNTYQLWNAPTQSHPDVELLSGGQFQLRQAGRYLVEANVSFWIDPCAYGAIRLISGEGRVLSWGDVVRGENRAGLKDCLEASKNEIWTLEYFSDVPRIVGLGAAVAGEVGRMLSKTVLARISFSRY